MKQHQRPNKGATHVWLTPPHILSVLGPFDLDPCAAPSPRPWPTARRHIELPEDGLASKWLGRVWLNPPFDAGLRPLWMAKMAEHKNGIMLIPAATETVAFSQYVWGKASSIVFLSERPHYHLPSGEKYRGNCGSAMCLVGYGDNNDQILIECGLGIFINTWMNADQCK